MGRLTVISKVAPYLIKATAPGSRAGLFPLGSRVKPTTSRIWARFRPTYHGL
jgi:hypothetical protein